MSANSSACAGDDDEFVVELGSEVGRMNCLVDFGVESRLDHGCWSLEERRFVTAIAAVASGAVGSSINFSECLPPLKSGTALRFLSRNRNIADHRGALFPPSLSIAPGHSLITLIMKLVLNLQSLTTVAFVGRALADQKPFWIEDETYPTHDDLFTNGIGKDDEFVTAFAGITTFAHLPFINCLHPTYREEAKEKFDIAIVGAPFDTSVTYRPG